MADGSSSPQSHTPEGKEETPKPEASSHPSRKPEDLQPFKPETPRIIQAESPKTPNPSNPNCTSSSRSHKPEGVKPLELELLEPSPTADPKASNPSSPGNLESSKQPTRRQTTSQTRDTRTSQSLRPEDPRPLNARDWILDVDTPKSANVSDPRIPDVDVPKSTNFRDPGSSEAKSPKTFDVHRILRRTFLTPQASKNRGTQLLSPAPPTPKGR
jgi:hypothetical protein